MKKEAAGERSKGETCTSVKVGKVVYSAGWLEKEAEGSRRRAGAAGLGRESC